MLRPSLPMMRPLSSSASRQLGLPHLAGDFVSQLLLDLPHQDSLSLLARHVGDALELALLLAVGVLELGFDIVQPLFLAGELALPPV